MSPEDSPMHAALHTAKAAESNLAPSSWRPQSSAAPRTQKPPNLSSREEPISL